jgi:hypothetical protein
MITKQVTLLTDLKLSIVITLPVNTVLQILNYMYEKK